MSWLDLQLNQTGSVSSGLPVRGGRLSDKVRSGDSGGFHRAQPQGLHQNLVESVQARSRKPDHSPAATNTLELLSS